MKILMKISTIFLLMTILLLSPFQVDAINSEEGIYYKVYDENEDVVEEGTIPSNREIGPYYSWNTNITLDNGWYTAFLLPGPKAFYVTKDTPMLFSYRLDRSAKIKYTFYSDSVPSTSYPTVWISRTLTASNSTILEKADRTNYYFVGITNVSSDPITITFADFTF